MQLDDVREREYQKRGTRYLYLVNSLKMVFVARGVSHILGDIQG